jgi:two-component system, OmpR family, sensor kinase
VTPSLRLRLLVILLVLLGTLWVAVGVATYFSTVREVQTQCDLQLAQVGRLLAMFMRHGLKEPDLKAFEAEVLGHWGGGPMEFQIWARDGKLLHRSDHAPSRPLADPKAGYADSHMDGQKWRVLTVADSAGDFSLQVGKPYDALDRMARWMIWDDLPPVLFLLPASALFLWLGIQKGVAPVRRIAADVAGRGHLRLDAVPVKGVPKEMRPLIEAMNGLFQRLRDAFDNESRFTADCAHEIRTPLAGIKTQVQVAMRAPDEGERRRALAQALQAVDGTSHLVQQLLALARCDPRSAALPFSSLDLNRVAVPVLADLTPDAIAKGVEVEFEEGADPIIQGNAEVLGLMVRNLVDNAIRHTPAGGRITVRAYAVPAEVCLAVEDTGPGIPPEEREHVFERFYRLSEGGDSGSGLGLSIVKRIAESHDAKITLANASGGTGLRVSVCFPAGKSL